MIGIKVSALFPFTRISSCASVGSLLDCHINTGDLDPGKMASSISAARDIPATDETNQITIKSERPGRLSTIAHCLLFRPLGKGAAHCKEFIGRLPFKAQCQGFTPGLVVSLAPWVHLPS